jgi:hypothetical protein
LDSHHLMRIKAGDRRHCTYLRNLKKNILTLAITFFFLLLLLFFQYYSSLFIAITLLYITITLFPLLLFFSCCCYSSHMVFLFSLDEVIKLLII